MGGTDSHFDEEEKRIEIGQIASNDRIIQGGRKRVNPHMSEQ